MKLTFYGASDDLVEVEGDVRVEHTVSSTEYGRFRLSPGDDVNGGVHIHVRYEHTGCWSVGVTPVDEEVPVPDDWHFYLAPQGSGKLPSYSSVLIVTTERDVTLTWEGDE